MSDRHRLRDGTSRRRTLCEVAQHRRRRCSGVAAVPARRRHRALRARPDGRCAPHQAGDPHRPRRAAIAGTATHTCAPSTTASARIDFDAAEMRDHEGNGRRQAGDVRLCDPVLRVDLGRALKAGAETRDRDRLRGVAAARPLLHRARQGASPKKPLQAWTQGQDEDSRHWYPCIDFPNHQQTSEVVVTVPDGHDLHRQRRAELVRDNARDGTRTYHWYQATPHVTYLLSQIVGEFAEIEHKVDGTPGAVLRPARPREPTSSARSAARPRCCASSTRRPA